MYKLKVDDKVKILQVKSIKNILGQGYMPDLTKQERHDLAVLSSYQLTYAHDEKHYIIFIRYTNDKNIFLTALEKVEAKEKEDAIIDKIDGVKLKEKNDNELSDELKVEIARKENHIKNIHNFKEAF